MRKPRQRLTLRNVASWVALGSLTAAVCCWASYRQDRVRLRKAAGEVVASLVTPSEQVLALLHWVHDIEGSTRNDHYFGWRRLGATPVQVLDDGGDCADKSRLLSALLREMSIPASMAICLDEPSGQPAHTIVEARIGPGSYMVVDPAFDLYFPTSESGGYHDLLDLRHDPGIVPRRVDELSTQVTSADRASRFYLRSSAAYDTATTINWEKNALTRWIRGRLHSVFGDDVFRISRPLFMEEPKLFLALVALVPGSLILVYRGWIFWKVRRWRPRIARGVRRPATGLAAGLAHDT